MAPTLVKRNEIVLVETRVGALTVQTRAKAMGDGIEGELVRCMNVGSKDEFVGVVLPNGTIYVQ
jgi:flagella basal body P-ring formation protein FlgA